MCFFFFFFSFKSGFIYTIKNNVIIYSDHEDVYLIPGATLFTARILS